jgi:hypothetical protein
MSDGTLVPNTSSQIGFDVPAEPVAKYFPLDRQDDPPPADTFEIGLVLGGTVSAGAYTAGVIDFLVEALDAWTAAKHAKDLLAPQHKVIIKIVSGTSGGGVNAVLLARALGYAFPPYDGTAASASNPLHDVWINQLDIRDMLKTDDLDETGLASSLLSASSISKAATDAGNYVGGALGTLGTPALRDYVDPLLPVILTLTNLRGVPYSTDFRGTSGRSEYYTDRADHIRYRVDITGKSPPAPGSLCPFEVGVSATPSSGSMPWSAIVAGARGTSAFPIGLPPIQLQRDVEHYRYRYAVVGSQKGTSAEWLKPDWRYLIAEGANQTAPFQFLAVDGGCFNNEPINYARQYLAGVLGENPREGAVAHRAIILVDPFADAASIGLTKDSGLFDTAGATLGAFTSGTRFETADFSLFTDENVFSRFLVNPICANPMSSNPSVVTGGQAIASSGVSAFVGFMSNYFREHDFLLGRQNCQSFLLKHFSLPDSNSLFADPAWTQEQRSTYGNTDPGFLPIIPLLGAAKAPLPAPTWPRGTFDPASLRDAIEARLEKLCSKSIAPIVGNLGPIFNALLSKGESIASNKAADSIVSAIRAELQKSGLI